MCCVCESSSLGLVNFYWYPHQWADAVKRALWEGRETGHKHAVYAQAFANGGWGWKVRAGE